MRIAAINWNQIILQKRLTAWATAGLLLASLLFQVMPVQAAGSSTMTLVPANATYNKGDSFVLTIRENSGSTAVNAVEANLVYDAGKLQFTKLDTNYNNTSTAFTLTAPSLQSGGGGNVSFSGGASPSVTGDQIVAFVTFTALVDSGSTNITFKSDSQLLDPNNNQNTWNGNPVGATINLTAVATGGSTSTPPPTPTVTSTKSKTTTTPAAPAPAPTPAASVPAPVAAETVAKTYFVAIKVTDDKGVVKGALVTLDDKSAHTDVTGQATFSGIASGVHSITAEVNGKKVTQSITVAASDASLDVQQFGIKVAASKTTNLVWIFVLLLALVVISGGGWTVGQSLTHRHRMAAAMNHNSTGVPAESITTNKATDTPESVESSNSQVFYPDPDHPLVNPPNDTNPNGKTDA